MITVATRRCDQCGEAYEARHPKARYCSLDCGRRVGKDAERARALGLPFERVPKYATYERDGWICYLCGLPTLRAIGSVDPIAPTFDHIVPLAEPESPGHIASNIRTAHRLCNLQKGNRSIDQFLAWRSLGPST